MIWSLLTTIFSPRALYNLQARSRRHAWVKVRDWVRPPQRRIELARWLFASIIDAGRINSTMIGGLLNVFVVDTGLQATWYRYRWTKNRIRHFYYMMRSGDAPNVVYFMRRHFHGRDHCSRYWVYGPMLERKLGVMGITDHMKATYYAYYYMPLTHTGTPAADIRARQLGAIESAIFQPVVPVSVAAPMARPLLMKVSSWVSNQLIPG